MRKRSFTGKALGTGYLTLPAMLALATAICLVRPVVAAEQDDASRVLVGKIVQAYGGAAAIERVTSVHAQGTIIALVRGSHGTYERQMARPRQLRVQTAYTGSSETRILNGDRTWRSNQGSLMRAVTGPGHLAMVYQYKQLDLPHGLLKGSYNLRYLGGEQVRDKATEAMEVWDDEGPAMRVNVDAVDHYIVKVTGFISVGSATTTLGVEFSDFKPVEGMVLPFRMHNYAADNPLSETVIRQYTVNPATQPSLFEPPVSGTDSARSAVDRAHPIQSTHWRIPAQRAWHETPPIDPLHASWAGHWRHRPPQWLV